MQVGGNFDEARKKRLDELAQQRTGAAPAANGATAPSAASPMRKTSSIPPRSPARPAASQVCCLLLLDRCAMNAPSGVAFKFSHIADVADREAFAFV